MDLQQDSWRVFQIMAEFVEGFENLSEIAPAVTIFGSARFEPDNPYYKTAERIAEQLSNAGFTIVTGGGPGIMAAANKGAAQGQSDSIGLNIGLPGEAANPYQNISLSFRHFFVRKVMLARYASAFVVLPGGFGTLDELGEVLTLVQTRKISHNPPIILFGTEFWAGLVDWLKNALLENQTIDAKDLQLVTLVDDPDSIVDIIFNHYGSRQIESIAERQGLSFPL